MKERLDLPVELTVGARGQFDVLVDGQVLAQRDTGFLKRLTGRGMPDPEDVIAALERELVAREA